MAKLYFHYSTMNAGKSTLLLQASHNYLERGMATYLMTARLDGRAGPGRIASRIGIAADADAVWPRGRPPATASRPGSRAGPCHCVFVDEAQFLTQEQVWQLARAVDDLDVPVMCYGLRTDFRGELFPGSAALLALADEMREVRTICHCGRKATMVVRKGRRRARRHLPATQIEIGGNDRYLSSAGATGARRWALTARDGGRGDARAARERPSRRPRASTQCIRAPSGTGRSGPSSTIAPSASESPSTSTSDRNLPICRGGKFVTARPAARPAPRANNAP